MNKRIVIVPTLLDTMCVIKRYLTFGRISSSYGVTGRDA